VLPSLDGLLVEAVDKQAEADQDETNDVGCLARAKQSFKSRKQQRSYQPKDEANIGHMREWGGSHYYY
jgi:hypothetical protein